MARATCKTRGQMTEIPAPVLSVSYRDLIRVFGRIGLLSFGGPAAQIALMHRALVDERPWLTEEQFLRALSFCMLLPGPEAMQLATFAGWRLRGVMGGLIAGGLFVLPGAFLIMALALAYGAYGQMPVVQALFLGVKAAIVVIVIEAILKVARRALKRPLHWVVAVLAFVGLFALDLPFPLIIGLAALAGALGTRAATAPALPMPPHVLRNAVTVIVIGGILWAAPVLLAWATGQTFLTDLGRFFSILAVVTFGGAYAVLAYMTQEVVSNYGWLTTAQMMDALGLAETTPGPLILVTQFVGAVAGVEQGGLRLGVLGGLMVLWVTFVPCFIWIFAGAPVVDWIEGRPRLKGALALITAAVVGVIANLSVWFAAHVFFGTVGEVTLGPISVIAPDLATLNLPAVALALVAAVLILWRHMSLPLALAICAALSLIWTMAGGLA